MINQLDAYQLEEDKVFHIHVVSFNDNTKIFIEQPPNPLTWEIFNSEKRSTLRHLDICFKDVDTFIETR